MGGSGGLLEWVMTNTALKDLDRGVGVILDNICACLSLKAVLLFIETMAGSSPRTLVVLRAQSSSHTRGTGQRATM